MLDSAPMRYVWYVLPGLFGAALLAACDLMQTTHILDVFVLVP